MARTRRRFSFRKLHRRVGVVLALFLCLLAVTGIALNHSDELGLDERYVPAWVASFYLGSDEVFGIQIENHYAYSFGGSLFVDRTSIDSCAELQGWQSIENQQVALCDGELLLLTDGFQLIERVDSTIGLPPNITALHAQAGEFMIRSGSEWLSLDLMSLDLAPAAFAGDGNLPNLTQVPADYLLGESVTWQKFILDVHSGIVVGIPGKLFTDIVAIFLILMVLSGLWMWRNAQGR